MEENGINEDQIEPILQEFAKYCLRHSISYDTVIKSGREALYLEEKFGIQLEKIRDYIMHAKETIDKLEDHRQDVLRKKQKARDELDAILQERDAIVAEIDKYGKEMPSIQRIEQLETELDEAKKLIEQYETSILGLKKELNDARLEAARFEGSVIETDARCRDYARRLSLCLDKVDKQQKENQQINHSENNQRKPQNLSLLYVVTRNY